MGLFREYKQLPGTVKVYAVLTGSIVIGAGIVVIGIPAAILLIAFPKLWIIIAIIAILFVIGYIKGR